MHIVCLDLEGVLFPEVWIAFAEKTRIEELRLTTRDISDYSVLMQHRIKVLREHNLKLTDIQDVISCMKPLEGAVDFLNTLREKTQVIILSDTFTQFAKPIMEMLGWPTIFCNELEIDHDGYVCGFKLRQEDGKKQAVRALKSLNYKVYASGDSYNDTTMLAEADRGFFFRPPEKIISEFPDFPVAREYDELLNLLKPYIS
ncbi:bifunctional phosphoserine phosphatase/homoserine phosphotransferase ThrH [Spirochaetia bacterium 38H-sp]|uniref:phosphoserine phosphatase n=1 Tax=Rarispira pelagica TaxID=3141764 RepID=A0ABU9U8V6_9SPIR